MRPSTLMRVLRTSGSASKSAWRGDNVLRPPLTRFETRLVSSLTCTGTGRVTLRPPPNTLPKRCTWAPSERHAAPLFQIDPSRPSSFLLTFRRPFSYFKPRSSPPWGGNGGGGYRNTYRRFGQEGSGWQNARKQPRWYIYRNYLAAGGGAFGVFYVYNLETVEFTGRRRFNCVSYATEKKLGDQNYRDILQEYRGKVLPRSHPASQMVERVMARLIPLADLPDADWKVHVIKDDHMLNAFVLPGGKVFVFTGILPICKDEDGLAAVLGHEVAHVVAHHPAERMSNSFITLGAVLVITTLFDVSGQLSSMLMNLMYGLPNSRAQEAEADNIGLMMMSKACYNPSAAVGLWARMQKAEKQVPPQFLSTHPSSYNRMESIRGWLPKAEQEYENSGCQFTGGYVQSFQDAFRNTAW